MRKNIGNDGAFYIAPAIESAEISVEQGFAGSGFGEENYAGDILSSEGNEYNF